MIRHILLFSLKENVASDVRRALLDDLARLPRLFAQIRNWEMGTNTSNRDDTYEYGVTMTFARREDMASYLESEAHERFVRDRFRPLISKRAIVSFELADAEHKTRTL